MRRRIHASTTNTLLGRSVRPDPSLGEVPVTTPAPEKKREKKSQVRQS
jgi:hypothetical protein